MKQVSPQGGACFVSFERVVQSFIPLLLSVRDSCLLYHRVHLSLCQLDQMHDTHRHLVVGTGEVAGAPLKSDQWSGKSLR